MLPIASNLATQVSRGLAESALPDSPVVADPPPREPRLRVVAAALLRRSAQRRNRLADRLDPVCASATGYAAG